ncbi:MAG: hypothetical protein ATN32_10595 [Candidatus Epulonipiscium fishelsonii]|nr:MAG: hypothetical protein ATN32_10595 [Epulopiscium sp. AS2M-Bin002]
MKQLVQSLGGVDEVFDQIPVITVLGNETLTIENFVNIVEYNDEIIRLKLKIGIVAITGKRLEAKNMTQDQITIKGYIEGINFIKLGG